ncbi:MAG: hypothetical protein H6976_08660 [Gammaproteobacteria bacterium]|nr:hypothetical protein [Gammaproteobacteria bacterium]
MDYRDPWTFPSHIDVNQQTTYQHQVEVFIEKQCLKHASAVVVVSPTWLEQIARQFRKICSRTKFYLILNGHDLDEAWIDGQIGQVARAVPSGKIRIHFNGLLASGSNLLDLLLKALNDFPSTHLMKEHISLSFCGIPDTFQDRVQDCIDSGALVNLGALSHQDSLKASLSSDALLLTMSSESQFLGAIPGKMYEAIALGKPILAIVPEQSDVRHLLADYPNVIFAKSDDPESVSVAFHNLWDQFCKNGGYLSKLTTQDRHEFSRRHLRRERSSEFLDLVNKVSQDNDG